MITKDGLLEIAKVVEPADIVAICDRINTNNAYYRTGLPDLISCGKKPGDYQLIEVKKTKDSLRFNQKKWMEYLLSCGIDAKVYKVPNE
jgi:hypothetical protein